MLVFQKDTYFIDIMIAQIDAFFWPLFMHQFIFSTASDGKIKAWLYDLIGSRVDYDALSHWCTIMSYSVDGTRLIHHVILVVASCHALFLFLIY